MIQNYKTIKPRNCIVKTKDYQSIVLQVIITKWKSLSFVFYELKIRAKLK